MSWVKDVHAYVRLDRDDEGAVREVVHEGLEDVDVLDLTGARHARAR